MTILTFGEELLSTGDLDPVYLAIQKAKLPEPILHRLCLAYWCFYSLGTASYIAEKGKTPAKFWDLMMLAAYNDQTHKGIPTEAEILSGKGTKPWPRGAERRHFRGANAVGPMSYLKERYKDASAAVLGMMGVPVAKALKHFDLPSDMTFKTVSSAVQTHPGFGPWMAFKIADMGERVLGFGVDFSNCELGIYKDPRQGAAVAYGEASISDPNGLVAEWQQNGEPWKYPITDAELALTVAHYVKVFSKFKPPGGGRKVNVQEVETIFCKYKSHLKGHYPLGKDTREVGHGLIGWGDLADQLRAGLPKLPTT